MTAHETTPSDAAKPFDLDPSRNRMRADFEHWYICHAFDYQRDPIGSEKCSLQWQAWKGAREIEQGRRAESLPPLPPPKLTHAGECPERGHWYSEEQMTAYGEACRRMPETSDLAWSLSHTQITPESALVEAAQKAPGPTTYVRRDYWVVKLGHVTEAKFMSYEMAKAHVPSLPPHGESR